MEKENVKTYLDYLDKEMTIMGIVSTFTVVTLGFSIDRLIFSDSKLPEIFKLWHSENIFCIIGLSSLLFAAVGFYRQRALLAWFYGQISLYLALGNDRKIEQLLYGADNWDSWIWYQVGFGFLYLAFGEIGLAIISTISPIIYNHQTLMSIGMALIWVLPYSIKIYSYWKYPEEDNAVKKYLSNFL
jgi:hypothetical protein